MSHLNFASRFVTLLVLTACTPATVEPAAEEIPARLSDTGLYADAANKVIANDVFSFEPQYPLWTDGATKQRWIQLPAGSSIDASNADAWIFPVGTRLWKEFAFEQRVETRYLLKRADGSWLRVAYLWNEDESDALLAPETGVRGAAQSVPGVPYDVPSRMDCATCHARGDGVLGFSALQLSPDRDPHALHASARIPAGQDLAAFVARGLVRGLPDEHLANPPRIRARTPRERAALGYLHTHCGSCHHDGGPLAGLELSLDVSTRAEEPSVFASTLDRPSRFRPADLPGCEMRIRPGVPELSAVRYRMSTRDPLKQMPPIGTRLIDAEAVALIEAWIREELCTPYDITSIP